MQDQPFKPDSVVETITQRFIDRAKFGFQKYETDLDRTDLSPLQWGTHALEEAHDLMLYMQKWIGEQEKSERLLRLLARPYRWSREGNWRERDQDLLASENKELEELLDWYFQQKKK